MDLCEQAQVPVVYWHLGLQRPSEALLAPVLLLLKDRFQEDTGTLAISHT